MLLNNQRSQRQDPIKMDLDIDLENFGPIKKGKIKLKPLTIFVGPNNSGKSYAATLIHSIISSENQINPDNRSFYFTNSWMNMISEFNNEIQSVVKRNKDKDFFLIPPNITKKIIVSLAQDIFGNGLESTINRNFASPVSELVNIKHKSAKITISNSNTFDILINKKLAFKFNSDLNFKCGIKFSKKLDHFTCEKEENGDILLTIGKEDTEYFLEHQLTDILIRLISERLKHDAIPANSYYFPATRSGILQGHQALSASIIKNASFGGTESFELPKLTGVISDFITNIILIPSEFGPFTKLSNQLESELLHGHIQLRTRTTGTFPEITYSSPTNEIPLHRTSSTISEIASLSLYLKHVIHHGSLLIIEEPEAQLHPASQLIFAKYIVKMIRAGLNVLITTHSVFLLEQLGKFMLANKLEPKKREKLGYGKDRYLLPEEVAPYVFVQDNEHEHSIQPIEINDEDGISQEEFVKVDELLYSESVKLWQNLPQNLA